MPKYNSFKDIEKMIDDKLNGNIGNNGNEIQKPVSDPLEKLRQIAQQRRPMPKW